MSFNVQNLTSRAETRLFAEIRKSRGAGITADKILSEKSQILLENIETKTFDIFLSHKSEDAKVILGIVEELEQMNYTVYVDWLIDQQLNRNNITKDTSQTLKTRMGQSKSLLFATTKHASDSKWMPWELGYMDGKKDKAAILPVFKDENSSTHEYKGQEYLGIYPYCIKAPQEDTATEKLWICEKSDIYVSFDRWLQGRKPYKR